MRAILASASVVWLAGYCGGALAECAPFEIYSPADAREAHFLDLDGDEQVSSGDKRAGQRSLFAADGSHIGTLAWVATIFSVDPDGKPGDRVMERAFVLEDGVIFATWEIRVEPVAPLHDTTAQPVPAGEHTARIIGGTGAYAGASGELVFENVNHAIGFQFNISCGAAGVDGSTTRHRSNR